MRYYRCVNCGLYHDLKEQRQRGITCKDCGYDEVSEMDQEEWDECVKIRPWVAEGISADDYFRREDPTYVSQAAKPKAKKVDVVETPKRKRRTKAEMEQKDPQPLPRDNY